MLHPEDAETQLDDLTIVILSRIIVREMYNDLGFIAGNRLIVLVEEQSTWSVIIVRYMILSNRKSFRHTRWDYRIAIKMYMIISLLRSTPSAPR